MHRLVAVIAAAAVCVSARPPDPVRSAGRHHTPPLDGEAIVRRLLLPRYLSVQSHPHPPPPQLPLLPLDYESRYSWLTKEIERLNMDLGDEPQRFGGEKIEDSIEAMPARFFGLKRGHTKSYRDEIRREQIVSTGVGDPSKIKADNHHNQMNKEFALTPFDEGYYESGVQHRKHASGNEKNKYLGLAMQRRGSTDDILLDGRPTRQNPNLSRNKLLIAEHLDKLKSGLNYDMDTQTDSTRQVLVAETTTPDPTSSLYGVALVAAVGAALTIALFGFAFGWYTISKKAKAAADVDYPAYGVTGPTVDNSGDRKLAHSAHMYHYQHQKQQILAMERNGVDQRVGSVSDPESEEENEEGDYTVYECPGFATTGDMEVKNPLFSDEPTPATPGKDTASNTNAQNNGTKE